MVEHGLDFAVEGGGGGVVLLGKFGQQQARVVELGVGDGVDELVHQIGDDAIAGEFYVDHGACGVDTAP